MDDVGYLVWFKDSIPKQAEIVKPESMFIVMNTELILKYVPILFVIREGCWELLQLHIESVRNILKG